jgi:LCP family protein required for cell wall assembly
MEQTQSKSSPATSSTVNRLGIILIVAFLIAAALTAYLTFRTVRDFITSWKLTSLPGVSISSKDPVGGVPVAGGDVVKTPPPLQPVSGPAPVAWDGASRVTVLIMGLDARDYQTDSGPPRTDTMLLLTIDPVSRTAGILSVPRDLWVNIPHGFGYGRINTAYPIGEGNKLPGGGPKLAMETVEELLGVPIQYYAQIDFDAFIKFIDEIGGVKINVPEKITVDPIVNKKNNTITLMPGIQTLPGELALAYARARHTEGGDFDRAQRQQQVIMAIRNQILRFDMIPTMMAKSKNLYDEFSAGVHTNLTLDEVFKLAWLAQQIPEDKIKQGIIAPPKQVSLATSPDGAQQVLKPITDQIRLLRDEIFTDTGPASPAAANMDPAALMKAEAAKVGVRNGTVTAGLAARSSEYLKSLGVDVTQADNAQQVKNYSEITFYTGKPYTVKYLVDLLKIDPIRIHYVNDPTSPVDVLVVLGQDWASKNPMP